ASGSHIRTSRPSPGRFTATYKHVAEQGYSRILSIHLSSKLSGTVEAARIAAQSSPVPVTVIDSYNAGMSLGNAVLDVLLRNRVGLSADFITTIATRQDKDGRTIVTLHMLDTLRNGCSITII